MSLSTSPGAYRDCIAVMQGAISDPNGVRMLMSNQDAAYNFRMRCHMARKIDREANAITYEKGHPLHNVSDLDQVQITMMNDDEGWWLVFKKTDVIPGRVESLTSGNQVELALPQRMPELEYEPHRQLAPPQTTNEPLGEAFEAIREVEIIPPKKSNGVRRI